MGKIVHDDILDAAVGYCEDNANEIVLLNADPGTSYTQAHSAFALGRIAVGSDSFVVANGDVSGRKMTVSAQSSIGVDVTGNCNHCAINDTDNSKVLVVTTVTSQELTSGNAASTPAFDQEIEDPT